jgi:hypothetical protein
MHFQIGRKLDLSRMHLESKPTPSILHRLNAPAIGPHNWVAVAFCFPPCVLAQISPFSFKKVGQQPIHRKPRQAQSRWIHSPHR